MIKFLLSVIFFPSVVFACLEAVKLFLAVVKNFHMSFYFTGGFALYAVLHYFIYNPLTAYVLSHEMTHVLAAKLSGFRVGQISVGKKGGYVDVHGSNAFVSLSPYCFPLYTVIFISAYGVCSIWLNTRPYADFFTAGVGFLMAFHIIHTFESLLNYKQSDVKHAGGSVFSWAVILFANSIVVMLCFKLLYPELVGVKASALAVVSKTGFFWRGLGNGIVKFTDTAVEYVGRHAEKLYSLIDGSHN
ncbi:MAG: hypothetical protein NTW04_02030 [Elusimicrobia bacterium]|nr:hypothetical protein [Elusimicrobiota bacterium]